MNLNDAYEKINFYVNKYQGAYFTPQELDSVVDTAQNAQFKTYYDEFASSQRLDDALAPFKTDYQFTTGTTPLGLISTPSDYLDLLQAYTIVQGSDGITRFRPVEIVSEEDLVNRLNSQVVPVTVNDPIGNIITNWGIQLYPKVPATGKITYLRTPRAPYYAYSVISGRVIVYDPINSVQLEWSEQDINSILLIALGYLGINMSEQDIMQFSEMKSQQNINTKFKQ